LGRRRRGHKAVREAKSAALALLSQHPKIKAGERISRKEALEWVRSENPKLLETLTEAQISGLAGFLSSPSGRGYRGNPTRGAAPPEGETPGGSGVENSGEDAPQNPLGVPPQPQETPSDTAGGAGTPGVQRKPKYSIPGGTPLPSRLEGEGRVVLERELWVKATPIIRKVVLNPKIWLYYDYARTQLGYEGDIGSFLEDCVEDFWRSRGYKIKIVQETEVS